MTDMRRQSNRNAFWGYDDEETRGFGSSDVVI